MESLERDSIEIYRDPVNICRDSMEYISIENYTDSKEIYGDYIEIE